MAPNTTSRLSRQESTEQPVPLSRSASSASTQGPLRPKSRGSTTSLQSVGVGNAFQPTQQGQEQNMPIDHSSFYMQNGGSQGHPMYPHHGDDSSLLHHPHMAQLAHPPMMDHGSANQQQYDMRPLSQHGFAEIQPFPMQYPNGMPQYQFGPQHVHHVRHASEQYEGSPAPEDSNTENGGAKRRKGTASSMANDQELRRLLHQYAGRSLKEVALEVQKNEGAGGKSEKAKQVFAMIWLQENCVRSTNSVRRDRVFARYTERCGNERVPTLNPASFGKLVRIIFPNVQTRRLGVRGESKYHYVDLSLVTDEHERPFDSFERPSTATGILPERPASSASTHITFAMHTKSASISQLPMRTMMETADFPIPDTSFTPRKTQIVKKASIRSVQRLDCQNVNTPTIRVPTNHMTTSLVTALPSVRHGVPATLTTYLAMPSEISLSQPVPSAHESPIELPDIYEYLEGTNYDHQIAKLLHDLYRSYCIDVIDAFRKCKDKSFFNHHSAFNGKMTVPVSKLFSMECVAPWIQECDLRMYKQILRYMTPLVLQNVPDPVWASFDRISSRLVAHLITSFEEKCPSHVVVAKVVPAARFTNLLKKLRIAQSATLQISRLLDSPQQRTQMWLDLCAIINPDVVLDESICPPESMGIIRGILKRDIRILLDPVPDALVEAAEQDPLSAFVDFCRDPTIPDGILSPTEDTPSEPLNRLTQWLESLPKAFEGHHPQCMLDWHSRFFKSLMTQFGSSGATSFQAWWYLELFANQMLTFMTQLEGLLLPAEEQKYLDDKESEKKEQVGSSLKVKSDDKDDDSKKKRKRADTDVDGEEHADEQPRPQTSASTEPNSAVSATFPMTNETNVIQDDADDMAEINRGGPLDLPSFKTGFTSPIKPQDNVRASDANALHDDSGIDLGITHDVDPDAIEAEREAKKFNKRDWFLSSDPVEPQPATGMV